MRPLIPSTFTAFLIGCSTFQGQKQDPPPPLTTNPVVLAVPPSPWPNQVPMPVYSSQVPYTSQPPYPPTPLPPATANLNNGNSTGDVSCVYGTEPVAPPSGAVVEVPPGADDISGGPPPAPPPDGCAGNGAMFGVSALAFIPLGGDWGSSGGNAHGVIPAGTVIEVKGGVESLGKIMDSVNGTGLHSELQSALGHNSSQNGPMSSLFTERHVNEFTPHFETVVHASSSGSSEASSHESSTSSKK